jgi:integrase/recombinase XerD
VSNPYNVVVSGPLGPYAEGFHAELRALGYRRNASSPQLALMAHLSRWLERRGLEPGGLDPGLVDAFLADRRSEGYTMWLSTKGVAPLLAFLRRIGVVPVVVDLGPVTAVDRLIEEFVAYLRSERGLVEGTIYNYVSVAGVFLAAETQIDDADLSGFSASDVVRFVLDENEGRSVRSAQRLACGLRAFLRFAFATGKTDTDLTAGVPTIASWRLSTVPRSISQSEVRALLRSCDRRTAFGRRDYAAMLLMIRLGLRSGEVAALELADVDWRAGDLIVRGKGSRVERLPLPVDVGEAVASWVRRGRPVCDSRRVFTRVRAPHRGLSVGGVGNIVKAAGLRAGIPHVHAHLLRHTAATRMLAGGADLVEIGQVLRHASVLTTSIYAKVDDDRLRALAIQWPTGARS